MLCKCRTGRCFNIQRDDIICHVCNSDFSDEFHYIFNCTSLTLRKAILRLPTNHRQIHPQNLRLAQPTMWNHHVEIMDVITWSNGYIVLTTRTNYNILLSIYKEQYKPISFERNPSKCHHCQQWGHSANKYKNQGDMPI